MSALVTVHARKVWAIYPYNYILKWKTEVIVQKVLEMVYDSKILYKKFLLYYHYSNKSTDGRTRTWLICSPSQTIY